MQRSHRIVLVLPLIVAAIALPVACARVKNMIGFANRDSAQGSAGSAAQAIKAEPVHLDGKVWGNVRYPAGGPLPSDAVLIVNLEDASGENAPARLITEQRVTIDARQPGSASFELNYDSKLIESGHRYALSASISAGAILLYTSGAMALSIDPARPQRLDLALKAVPTP